MNRMKKACKSFFLLSGILLFPVNVHASTLTYAVEQGDTLTKIAKKYQTTVNDLMALNQLTTDKLAIGQAILVSQQQNGSTNTVLPKNASDSQDASGSQNIVPAENTNLTAVSNPPSISDSNENQISRQPDSSEKVIVNADALNVRETPSLKGAILSKLSTGTLLDVMEKGPEWTKIRWGNKEAYVASMYITTMSELPLAFQPADNNEFSSKLLEIIQPLLKTRYILGGSTPDGFDCSGFTSYVFQQFGFTLPRTSEEQFSVGQEVTLEQAQPGDLLFYDSLKKGHISHVAIYMGDGMIVHANGTEVKYEKVANMHKLYPFYGLKRLIPLASPDK